MALRQQRFKTGFILVLITQILQSRAVEHGYIIVKISKQAVETDIILEGLVERSEEFRALQKNNC